MYSTAHFYFLANKVQSAFAKGKAKRTFGARNRVRNLLFFPSDIAKASFGVLLYLLQALQLLLNKALHRDCRFVAMVNDSVAKRRCYLLPCCLPAKPRIAHIALCSRFIPVPPLSRPSAETF